MNMKKVWVTGAHGFLGRNLCRRLADEGFYVVGIGHGHWAVGEAEAFGLNHWVFSDLTLAALYDLESEVGAPETIYHLAGSGSVAYSLANPYLDYQRTVQTTLDVLEFIRLKSPNTPIIYPSSSAVYGVAGDEPIKESIPLNPISPYGTHKKIVEELFLSYATHFNVSSSLVRFFSIYGKGLRKQLFWDLCCKFDNRKGDVILHGSGDEARDWIYVDDAVALMIKASEKVYEMMDDKMIVVNGGTGVAVTVRAIVDELRNQFGSKKEYKFNGVTREGDPQKYLADIGLAESWDWKPTCEWRTGLADYVRWFKKESKL